MRAAQDAPVIALAGNPNVGKSTVFNALTGSRQHTGNWSGKTVSNAYGVLRCGGMQLTLVDLPGTYSLRARSAEEQAARGFLASGKADAVILVADATCLERNLILVLQVLEITSRAVLCLNLMDEARKKRIRIDVPALERELGIPVVPCAARRGRGLPELTKAVCRVLEQGPPSLTARIRYPDAVETAVQQSGLPRAAALEALVRNPPPGMSASRLDDMVTAAAAQRAEEIALTCVQVPATAGSTASYSAAAGACRSCCSCSPQYFTSPCPAPMCRARGWGNICSACPRRSPPRCPRSACRRLQSRC